MKIFSSLIAFVMMFACLSVTYADMVPTFPRPRPNSDGCVTAYINDSDELTFEIEFPYYCNYKYRLVDKNTDQEISSENGNGTAGETVIKSVDLSGRLSDGENYFVLTVEMTDIKTQTRFGTKKRQGSITWTHTIVVDKNSDGYEVHIYDDERD